MFFILFAVFSCPLSVSAGIVAEEAFVDARWELLFEDTVEAKRGIVQSICVVSDGILCLENTKDGSGEPDVVKKYSLEDYSLVKRVQEHDYDHANGMAYHPGKGEVAVAPYRVEDSADSGCVYLMDPDTLAYVGKVNVLDEGEVLGIGYYGANDGYIIQTDAVDGYSFLVLDRDFQVVEDLGEQAGTCKGRNFQDLCVSGDYIVNFPLTLKTGLGSLVNVYSAKDGHLVNCVPADFGLGSCKSVEPESVCELAPGRFLAAVKCVEGGTRKVKVFSCMVPFDFPALGREELIEGGYLTEGGDGRSGIFGVLAPVAILAVSVAGVRVSLWHKKRLA